MAQEQDIAIGSLRGGFNDTDEDHAIDDDQCTEAMNVEWFFSTFGERRAGCEPLDMTGSGITQTSVVHISQWFPNNDMTAPELWAVGATPGNPGVPVVFARRTSSVSGTPTWSTVALVDACSAAVPGVYEIHSKEINGKKFWAYPPVNGIDRLHVWDGSGLRLAGLGQPDAPTLTNEGSGNYSGDRFFRIRHIAKSGTTILRRSEPSASAHFHNDAGTGLGVTITHPTTMDALNTHANEGQTHWEIEASKDDATFYLLTTLPISTTTYNDETVSVSSYSAGELSEAVGAYLCQPSGKFLAVDEDRLIAAGHTHDTTKQSQINITPVTNDPGVGNDERVPIVDTGGTDIVSTYNLDNNAGGPITGISDASNGVWYAFKWSRIYIAHRTNNVSDPYEIKMLTDQRGAVSGSVFNGIDENGGACVYFTDPQVGPSRIGSGGLQLIRGIRATWKRVNLKATVVARGVYYPYKEQALWWVAVDGSDTPSLGLRLQTSEIQVTTDGEVKRGWSLFNGTLATALSVGLYTEWVNDGGTVTLSTRPFVGLATPNYVQRMDVGTQDAGVSFSASITTKAFMPAGLLGKWGALVASLLATALTGATVVVRLIRDFGVETTAARSVSLTPIGTETLIIKDLDDVKMAEARAIQVKISDS